MHRLHRVRKRQHAGDHQRRVLTQAVTRQQLRLQPTRSQMHPRCHAVDQNCRLGVLGQAQFILRSIETQTPQIVAQNRVGLFKQPAHLGIHLPQVPAHADELRALAREYAHHASGHLCATFLKWIG